MNRASVNWYLKQVVPDFPGGSVDKNLPCNAGDLGVGSLVQEDSTCCGATKPITKTTEAHSPRACALAKEAATMRRLYTTTNSNSLSLQLGKA